MIHGAKRKSKKYDADNSTHNRGKLTLVHCAASFSHPCLLRTLSSDKDTEAILAMGLADLWGIADLHCQKVESTKWLKHKLRAMLGGQ